MSIGKIYHFYFCKFIYCYAFKKDRNRGENNIKGQGTPYGAQYQPIGIEFYVGYF